MYAEIQYLITTRIHKSECGVNQQLGEAYCSSLQGFSCGGKILQMISMLDEIECLKKQSPQPTCTLPILNLIMLKKCLGVIPTDCSKCQYTAASRICL